MRYGRNTITATILVACIILFAGGCFRNNPEGVSKRFIQSIKGLKWAEMEKLVDWDESGRYLGSAYGESRRDIILNIAFYMTGYDLKAMTTEKGKHKLIYMSVDSVKALESREDTAKVKTEYRVEKRGKTAEVVFNLRKIDREWKIILTPDLMQRRF